MDEIRAERPDWSEDEIRYEAIGEYLTEQCETVDSYLVCIDNDIFVTLFQGYCNVIPEEAVNLAAIYNMEIEYVSTMDGSNQVMLR